VPNAAILDRRVPSRDPEYPATVARDNAILTTTIMEDADTPDATLTLARAVPTLDALAPDTILAEKPTFVARYIGPLAPIPDRDARNLARTATIAISDRDTPRGMPDGSDVPVRLAEEPDARATGSAWAILSAEDDAEEHEEPGARSIVPTRDADLPDTVLAGDKGSFAARYADDADAQEGDAAWATFAAPVALVFETPDNARARRRVPILLPDAPDADNRIVSLTTATACESDIA